MSNDELWSKVSTEGQLSDEEHIELMNRMFKAIHPESVKEEEK